MARLTDPETLRHYRLALSNYQAQGYVEFSREAKEWLRVNLGRTSQVEFARLLHVFVREGGEIDRVDETRKEWSGQYAYHYDFRLMAPGWRKRLYVETRLVPDHPRERDNPYIMIVNIHDA